VFFALWTAVVALSVGSLLGRDSTHPDLVIALDRSGDSLGPTQIRRWVDAHVEIYLACPWILLAPYVVWLGFRLAIEKRGWPWRLAAHLALGAGFIYIAQTVTHRLEAMRPRAVFLRQEEIVQQVAKNGTNAPTTVASTTRLEWHGYLSASSNRSGARLPAGSVAGKADGGFAPSQNPDPAVQANGGPGRARLSGADRSNPDHPFSAPAE
jgi:hypothetical protein